MKKQEKIQTGLRIPQHRYDEISEIAERGGLSINAVILFLVDVGLKAVNRGAEELPPAELRSLLHNDEECAQ